MKDSISRCHHSNHYSYQSFSVQGGSGNKAPRMQSRDILEMNRERLRDEEAEIIRRLSSQLPQASLIVVARVGKFLLIAVFYPPYFIFFRAPQWILSKGMPFILQWATGVKNHLLALFSRLRARGHRLSFFLRRKASQLVSLPKKWVRRIEKRLKAIAQQVSRSFQNGMAALFSPFQKARQSLLRLGEGVGDFFRRQKQSGAKALRTIAHRVTHPLAKMREAIRRVTERTRQRLEKGREALRRTLESLGKNWAERGAALRHFLGRLGSGIQERVVSTVHQFRQQVSRFSEMVFRPIRQTTEKIQNVVKSVGTMLSLGAQKIQHSLQQMLQPLFSLGPKLSLLAHAPFLRMGRLGREGWHQMMRRWQKMQEALQNTAARLLRYLEKVGTWSLSLWRRLLAFCLAVAKKTLSFLLWIVPLAWKGFLSSIRWSVRKLRIFFKKIGQGIEIAGRLASLSWHMTKEFFL